MTESFKEVHDGISQMMLITSFGTFITLALLLVDVYASLIVFGINPLKGFKREEEPDTDDNFVAVTNENDK